MATTRYKLAEGIKRRLDGGNSPVGSKYNIREVIYAVEQATNTIIKASYTTEILSMGERIPNGCAVAMYEGLEVEKWKNKSRVKLPATPVGLPRDIGIFSIWYVDEQGNMCEFIPLQMGQGGLIKDQNILSGVLSNTYERFGDYVVFNADLTVPDQTITVDMRLVLMDTTIYGDNDLLPISADQEFAVADMVFRTFMGEPIADKLQDPGRKEQKNVPINQQIQAT